MCRYCDTKDGNWGYKGITFDGGVFGTLQVMIGISDAKKAAEVEFGQEGQEPVITADLSIGYCPFCGRKLKEAKSSGGGTHISDRQP